VLEDNLRCPSGVSYMLENREILKRTFPELFKKLGKPVYNYTHFKRYIRILTEVEKPTIVVLTPGILAYF
jgi:uncharacterized circularly permuted ATP-grasp superfamily protein